MWVVGSQAALGVEEVDQERGFTDQERRGQCDQHPRLALASHMWIAGMRSDGPRDRRDRDTRHGRNEPEREQGPHDGLQGSDPGQARTVWLDVDVADTHVDYPSRPPGGLIPPTQRIPRAVQHAVELSRRRRTKPTARGKASKVLGWLRAITHGPLRGS